MKYILGPLTLGELYNIVFGAAAISSDDAHSIVTALFRKRAAATRRAENAHSAVGNRETAMTEIRPHWAEELTQESRMLRTYNALLVNTLARIAHSDAQCGEDAMRMRNIATAVLHPDKAGIYDSSLPTYRGIPAVVG